VNAVFDVPMVSERQMASVSELEFRIGEWLNTARTRMMCTLVHLSDEGKEHIVFVWPHSMGDAHYMKTRIERIFDERQTNRLVDVLEIRETKRPTRPSSVWDVLGSTVDAARALLLHDQPRRQKTTEAAFKLLRQVGTTSDWKACASRSGCTINDVFLWMTKKAVARIEGDRAIYVSVVRNHRQDQDQETRNAHAHTVVRLPAPISMRSMPNQTRDLKRWTGMVYWALQWLPTRIMAWLYRWGEPQNAVVTSNVRLDWKECRVCGSVLSGAYVTTINDQTTVHLTSAFGKVRVCVSSRWKERDEYVSGLQELITAFL